MRDAAARGPGRGGQRRRRRRGHRGRVRGARATSTTTWPSWWSSPRPPSSPRSSARSPPSRSWCPRPGGWPPRRSGSWGMDAEQTELACLLVSEVVTNAVLHASVTPSPGRELDFDLDPLIMSAAPVGAARTPEPVPARPRGRPAAAVKATAAPARTAPAPVQGAGAGLGRRGAGRRPPGTGLAGSSRCACGAARTRCGSRSSTPTCGCPGSGRRRKPTRADAACTWSSSSPPGGDRGPRPRARRSGSRCRAAAAGPDRPSVARRGLSGRCALAHSISADNDHDDDRADPVLARDGQLQLAAQPRPGERHHDGDEHQQDESGVMAALLKPRFCEPAPSLRHPVRAARRGPRSRPHRSRARPRRVRDLAAPRRGTVKEDLNPARPAGQAMGMRRH